MQEIKYCDKYVGVRCVDGTCPITLANEYPEIYGYDMCTCGNFMLIKVVKIVCLCRMRDVFVK